MCVDLPSPDSHISPSAIDHISTSDSKALDPVLMPTNHASCCAWIVLPYYQMLGARGANNFATIWKCKEGLERCAFWPSNPIPVRRNKGWNVFCNIDACSWVIYNWLRAVGCDEQGSCGCAITEASHSATESIKSLKGLYVLTPYFYCGIVRASHNPVIRNIICHNRNRIIMTGWKALEFPRILYIVHTDASIEPSAIQLSSLTTNNVLDEIFM
mmetsp:Transcript_14167/g.23457  ORF Transcript_14167/g.23457 Transcript_14167/m.23457 type:complete len:214 (-) Transcript_14167:484-1125(-)